MENTDFILTPLLQELSVLAYQLVHISTRVHAEQHVWLSPHHKGTPLKAVFKASMVLGQESLPHLVCHYSIQGSFEFSFFVLLALHTMKYTPGPHPHRHWPCHPLQNYGAVNRENEEDVVWLEISTTAFEVPGGFQPSGSLSVSLFWYLDSLQWAL